jgi:hypothetical protein
MMQPRQRLSFTLKSNPLLCAGEFARQQHLEGHNPIKRNLSGTIDDPHPTASQFLVQHKSVDFGQ